MGKRHKVQIFSDIFKSVSYDVQKVRTCDTRPLRMVFLWQTTVQPHASYFIGRQLKRICKPFFKCETESRLHAAFGSAPTTTRTNLTNILFLHSTSFGSVSALLIFQLIVVKMGGLTANDCVRNNHLLYIE